MASVCALMSLYVSKREVRISGIVHVRRPFSLSMRSARNSESTYALIFWMMVRSTIVQRLNVPILSLCRRTASDI